MVLLKKFEKGNEEKLVQFKVIDVPHIHNFIPSESNDIYKALHET